jgi:hypothetical protein
MVKLNTAEQVMHFMHTSISLGRFDERFIESLQLTKKITTNQVELFYKLIYKYRKQFVKYELVVEQLIELPWKTPIVESSVRYTEPYLSIVDNKIIFKCPYNKNFIETFRNQKLNNFIWEKDKRYYEADYGQQALKLLITAANKHFKKINFCEVTTKLLETLIPFEPVKYWHPTLVNVNGNLLIAATNESINKALGDTKFSTDLPTLSNLTSYGVQIDKSLYDNNDNRSIFFANFEPKLEIKSIQDTVEWVKELGCVNVLLCGANRSDTHRYFLIEKLRSSNISFVEANLGIISELDKDKPFVVFNFKSKLIPPYIKNVLKIVEFVNSEPIEIK